MSVTPLRTATSSSSSDVDQGMQAMIAALLRNQPATPASGSTKHWSTGLCVGDCIERVLRLGR